MIVVQSDRCTINEGDRTSELVVMTSLVPKTIRDLLHFYLRRTTTSTVRLTEQFVSLDEFVL